MSVAVNISQLKSCLDVLIKVLQENQIRVPALIHGIHALGKTEIVAQLAKERDFNFVPLYLSTQDVSDLLGLPYKEVKAMDSMSKDEIEKIMEKTITRFAPPDWLADALNSEKPCIFFLDEMNRGPLYVLQTMLPFVLEGRLHTHNIRPQDIVIGAMNPNSADYNVETVSDKALLSRFAHFYFEPSVSEWLDYAHKTKCHPSVLEVVRTDASILGNNKVLEDDRIKAEPDRRNLWKIGQMLNHMSAKDVNHIGHILFASMIGEDNAIKITTQYKLPLKLTFGNILDGSIFTYGLNFDEDLDRIRMVNESFITELSDGEGSIWKINKKATPSPKNKAVDFTYAEFIINKKEVANLVKWINSIPTDAKVGLLKNLKYKFNEKYNDDTAETKNKAFFIIISLFKKLDHSLIRSTAKLP